MIKDLPPAPSQPLRDAGLALHSLTVYRRLLDEDQVIYRLHALSDFCRRDRTELELFLNRYCDFFAALAASATGSLEDYLISAILFHDNPFTRSLERDSHDLAGLEAAAAHDLNCLQQIANLAPAIFKAYAVRRCCESEAERAVVNSLPEWQTHRGANMGQQRYCRYEELNHSFQESNRWSDCLEGLISFHRQNGAGIFARYRAFYWDHADGAGCLRGIADPDPVALSDLIDYETERAEVIENTLQFLNGWPANNVLLYGDRGTGKSSTVKALLNEYHQQGLRLVEAPKTRLLDFPAIIRQLKDRGEKFILFVDDLSFGDSEDSYTTLKAVLEGGLEHRPGNVLIYATSNRRHLIRERFSDRAGLQSGSSQEEVRAGDTVQEKLSLADRFGITVIFSTPDQDRYLQIVEGIAVKRGLRIDREQLHRAALNWECWHNGRSPRTARQFVDWLEGKINSEANACAHQAPAACTRALNRNAAA